MLEGFLGAGDASLSRVDFHGLAQGAGEGFEHGLGDVVAVAPVEELGVDVGAEVASDCAEEFLDEGEGEVGRVKGRLGASGVEAGARNSRWGRLLRSITQRLRVSSMGR